MSSQTIDPPLRTANDAFIDVDTMHAELRNLNLGDDLAYVRRHDGFVVSGDRCLPADAHGTLARWDKAIERIASALPGPIRANLHWNADPGQIELRVDPHDFGDLVHGPLFTDTGTSIHRLRNQALRAILEDTRAEAARALQTPFAQSLVTRFDEARQALDHKRPEVYAQWRGALAPLGVTLLDTEDAAITVLANGISPGASTHRQGDTP